MTTCSPDKNKKKNSLYAELSTNLKHVQYKKWWLFSYRNSLHLQYLSVHVQTHIAFCHSNPHPWFLSLSLISENCWFTQRQSTPLSCSSFCFFFTFSKRTGVFVTYIYIFGIYFTPFIWGVVNFVISEFFLTVCVCTCMLMHHCRAIYNNDFP